MKFPIEWVLIAVFVGLCGCTATIMGESLLGNQQQSREIIEKCRDLKKKGDVSILTSKIDDEMDAIEELLGRIDLSVHETKIKAHARKVTSYTEKLIEILGSEYSKLDYTQFVRWNIESSVFRPVSAKIEKVIIWNGDELELKKDFNVKIMNDGVRVQLIRPASLIEICQLEKLMNVALSVVTEDDLGHQIECNYRLKMKGGR